MSDELARLEPLRAEFAARLEPLRAELARATTLTEIKLVRDKATALEGFVRSQRLGFGLEQDAAEIKLRAEWQAGGLLHEEGPPRGRRWPESNSRTLRELEIDKDDSARWQRLATLALAELEVYFTLCRKHGREMLRSDLLRRVADQAASAAADGHPLPVMDADLLARFQVADAETFLAQQRDLDAIITDPPYGSGAVGLYGPLAHAAAKALKPEGTLAVMCGQATLPAVLAAMVAGPLPYRWTLAYLTPGGQAAQIFPAQVNTFWKPVLLFGAARHWIGDVVRSAPNDNDKRFHAWGQSESGMRALIELLTEPGDRLADPFLGGGTTAAVGLALGRDVIGCDQDAACVEATRRRVVGDPA